MPMRMLHTDKYHRGWSGGQGALGMSFEALTPERRRAMTRQHLLDAAAIVFARDGFHGSTLDEVAATAGFTKGAVYSNFKSKDDLFLELLDERINREFAVVADVLAAGSREQDEQFPRVRDLILGMNVMFWDDAWNTLYLEFVLYARRNPEAQAKLAATARRSREFVQALIEHEYAAIGGTPKYPTRELAEISLALYSGLGIDRLIDPSAITEQTFDTTLALLYDSMGVDGTPKRTGLNDTAH
jgi:AcrR family transcriptional regulator